MKGLEESPKSMEMKFKSEKKSRQDLEMIWMTDSSDV